jgi:hypothetical protein
MNSLPKSVFKDQEAVKCISSLHDKYVIIPADKASNNIVFVCKSYYFKCLIKELGINNSTYATKRVNSFTIFLLSLFYCRQNLCQVNRQFFRRTS